MEYTSEQLNYFRICYIIFNLVPEGLRKVFKQEWDFRYTTIGLGEWKDTPQNGRDFYNNESRRSHVKNARYLSTIQNGNTAEWDCSCLVFAILYSDSIGTTLGPTVRKDVDDLRQARNDTAHITEAELTDAEFHNYVAKVLAVFSSLKLSVIASDIQAIKNQASFPTAEVKVLKMQADNLKAELKQAKQDLQTKEQEVETLTQEINSKVKSFCNLTFKPSHEIIRRANDVTRIMKKMEDLETGSNGAVSTIYLSGNPGCGKSQIARQIGQEVFEKRSRQNKGLTFVATLNAETLETLADSYMALATVLKITEYTLTNLATSKANEAKESIQHLTRLILPQMKEYYNWLIIADNVVDLSLVRSHLPPTGSKEWGNGQVLITTQDSSSIPSNAPLTYHESLSGGLQPDDAVALLKQVARISNQEEVEKVAEVLEYQPLALAAAAFYVQTVVTTGSPNFNWTYFLEIFYQGKREATEEPLAKQNLAYSKTMTTAIKIAIDKAAESDEVLHQVFCLFSLCASDSLPLGAAINFVKFRVAGQTEELIRAKILKSSLITYSYNEHGEPAYVRVHNIVHDLLKTVLASYLQQIDGIRCILLAIRIFHSLMATERDFLFSSGDVCVKLRTVTTHCKAIHEILTTRFKLEEILPKESPPLNTTGDVVSWLCSSAEVSRLLSNPSDAMLFSTSALKLLKYISSTQAGELLKAKVFAEHGNVMSLHCKYEISLSYYKQAATIYTAIYNEKHPDVAGCQLRLGNVYHDLGQHKRAKEHYEKALNIRRTICGEQHSDVAASYNNLGNVYRALGQHNQAKEHYEKALNIFRTIYGEQHSDVGASYNNLGAVYQDLGQHNQAKEHHEKALNIRRTIYGEQHSDVAASYNNLGNVYRALGQHNQAKKHHEKALNIRRTIYGEQHSDVGAIYNNLGLVYQDLGQHNQAKEHHEKALNIFRTIYGEQHSDVAASYNNLGLVYQDLGQHNQAKEHHEKALNIRRTIYGEQHSNVAASYNNLGLVYQDLGQHNQAKEHYEKALNIRRTTYGEQHSDVGASYNNLGLVYQDLGQHNQAKEHHEKALNIRRTIYGEQHSKVAASYNNLGLVYQDLGQHNQAKEHHEKALNIRRTIYGEQHSKVAASYNNLGLVYQDLGQHNQAKEHHEKALNIFRTIYGEQHSKVAASYNNLGLVYQDLGQHNQAKEHHEKALNIRRTIYGEQHSDVAASYNNLGNVYQDLGQHNQAKEHHEKALNIFRTIYGEQHSNVAASYNNLGLVYQDLGQHNQAKEHHEKALNIRRTIYGEQHSDVAASYNNLGNVYRALGQHN